MYKERNPNEKKLRWYKIREILFGIIFILFLITMFLIF
jgi:hypothetical protein